MISPAVLHATEKKLYVSLREPAQKMKYNPTIAEALLWRVLSGKKLGVKFRRQHIIHRFIVDFYCIEKALVIEVDGEVHDNQKIQDHEREKILQALGCNIIRFRNEEIVYNLREVILKIRKILAPQSPKEEANA